MKIVMLGPFGMRPLGTMRARALPMAAALAARGHQVTVVVPPWQNPDDSGLRLVDRGVTVENIRIPRRMRGWEQVVMTFRLARQSLRVEPDIIHAFKPKAYSGLVHWLFHHLGFQRRIPIVVDTDDWEGAGGWNDRGEYTRGQRRFFSWQEHWGLAHADAVTVASRTLEGLAWAGGVQPDRCFYVPNGVSTQGQDDPGWGVRRRRAGHVMLLYTRFAEFGLSRVIDLLAAVRRRVPDARLQVVGAGLRGEEQTLSAQARERGLGPALSLNRYDAHSLIDYIVGSAVAIYPLDDTLINRAKSPVKLLELLNGGVPVVADAVGEAREFIRHGETGWLIRPGDSAAFSEAVVTLLEDANLQVRLGAAAARDIRDRYSWDRTTETVLKAYQVAGENR